MLSSNPEGGVPDGIDEVELKPEGIAVIGCSGVDVILFCAFCAAVYALKSPETVFEVFAVITVFGAASPCCMFCVVLFVPEVANPVVSDEDVSCDVPGDIVSEYNCPGCMTAGSCVMFGIAYPGMLPVMFVAYCGAAVAGYAPGTPG
jgi:hypothetical protein